MPGINTLAGLNMHSIEIQVPITDLTRQREGLEAEIHPASDPSRRTHVWVLPREGRDGTVYAAVFPSLPADDYTVLEPDGSAAATIAVPPNRVTNATWG